MRSVLSVQPRTVVVVHSPGAVLLPWAANASAILMAFVPGQADGAAITVSQSVCRSVSQSSTRRSSSGQASVSQAPSRRARCVIDGDGWWPQDLLWGREVPGGKLPITLPNSEDETWLQTPEQYPGRWVGRVVPRSRALLAGRSLLTKCLLPQRLSSGSGGRGGSLCSLLAVMGCVCRRGPADHVFGGAAGGLPLVQRHGQSGRQPGSQAASPCRLCLGLPTTNELPCPPASVPRTS